MAKSCRKFVLKASPRSLFNFVIWAKTAVASIKILLKVRCFETGLSKTKLSKTKVVRN